MSNSASTLLVPVETQVREMDAKILFSCVAAERGFPVIIGSRAFIHFKAASIPRSVYLAKSMRAISVRMFDILRKLGHEIVAWDEEGLMRWPDPEYYRQRLSPVTMKQISHLIAWGPDNARAFREYPGYHGAPIHATGNPRIDLMRPELRDFYKPEADAIRRTYGDFVLVNTNFGLVNHFYSKLSVLKKAVEAKDSQSVQPYDVGKGHHKLALFSSFKEMLPHLCAALSPCTVVVRPHPSENHEPYLSIAKECDNMRVDNKGNVHPWLMASKAVIANGCTTMIEAAVMDTPAIGYQPVVSKEFDDEMPNSLSHRCYSIDEICTAARNAAQGKLGPIDYILRRKILDQHIASLDGPLAVDRTVDILEKAGYGQKQPPPTSTKEFISAWLHANGRNLVKHINMIRPGHRNNLDFHAHRFPDISVDQVRDKVTRMGKLLNRFDDIKVEQYSRYIFSISK